MDEKTANKIYAIIKKQREKQPDKFYKYKILDFLCEGGVDLLISISNRGPGKTYGVHLILLLLNKTLNVIFLSIVRHYALQKKMLDTIMAVMADEKTHPLDKITISNEDDWVEVGYKGNIVFSVTDLNNAGDLKYSSQYLRKFDLIIYDEFIAHEYDYLPNEVEFLKIIYTSMDREYSGRVFQNQKIILLGNAMNFSSPIIAYYDLFNNIERQDMNTLEIHEKQTKHQQTLKIALELMRFDVINENKNPVLFDFGDDDYDISGEFKVNSYLICHDDQTRNENVVIKYDDKYIKCSYKTHGKNIRIVVNVLMYSEDYHYCNKISDLKDGVKYLTDQYFDKRHIKYILDRDILFANTFSLNFFSDNEAIQHLLIRQIVSSLMYTPEHVDKMKAYENKKARELAKLEQFYEY